MKAQKKFVIVLSWIMLGSAALYVNFMPQSIPVPLNKPLSDIPLAVDGWRGSDKKISVYPVSAIGSDDVLVRDYFNTSGENIEICLDYFNYTKDGKTPYPPQTSWVTKGWLFKDMGEESLALGGDSLHAVTVKKVLAEHLGNKTILFYVYNINGQYTPDFTRFRMLAALDTVMKRRSSALFLQLSSVVRGQDQAAKESAMKEFLVKIMTIAEKDILPK
jgi:EpsI family protein